MLKQRILLLLAALAALCGVLALIIRPAPEPEYGGQNLSEWVIELVQPATSATAADAIRQIGTNALPYLVEWVGYETPAWKNAISWTGKLLRQPRLQFIDHMKVCRSAGAMYAFKPLGVKAQREIGNLSRIANDPTRTESRRGAMSALADIGVAALPTIVGVLTNEPNRTKESRYLRVQCAIAISKLASEDPDTARLAEPTLRRMCEETNAMTRAFATNTLRELDPERIERMRRLRKAREDR